MKRSAQILLLIAFIFAVFAGLFLGKYLEMRKHERDEAARVLAELTLICKEFGEMHSIPSRIIGTRCYVKYLDIWVSLEAYDGRVKSLLKQDRLQVLK